MTTERKTLSPEVVGLELPASTFDYEERDVMLYALGIGAKELPFIFERELKVIPTFAVIPAFPALMGLAAGVEINPVMILHGEQGFRIAKTIPTNGSLTTSGVVTGVYDKGKGALVTIDSTTTDASGETVFTNTSGVFVRGAGGFGGDRGPSAANKAPERAPDKTLEDTTLDIQAAIYRLSGDRNPLHIDPGFSKMAGYDRPILHGLCSFGYAGRAVLAEYCDNDPDRLVG
jgi:acyl dehydratase